MQHFRNFLNENAWVGWVIALVAVAVAVAFATGTFRTEPADGIARRSEDVTIRCTETGETWTMNRGQFERLLLTMPGAVDPDAGIPSKFAQGRLTGVLVDDKDWKATVERINEQKEMFGG